MSGRLKDEIKQRKPFASKEVEAVLNIVRTADGLSRKGAELLKAGGLSGTQYNVLRILRGAGSDGCACREIGERMVTHDPDITRLLDRMERNGWVTRARDGQDRRVVSVRITKEGLKLAEEFEAPLLALHKQVMRGLNAKDLEQLIELLEKVRANCA